MLLDAGDANPLLDAGDANTTFREIARDAFKQPDLAPFNRLQTTDYKLAPHLQASLGDELLAALV